MLHAIAVPGYQVPFGSRELPIGRGWGTGGIQLTMSLIGPEDTLKVIDQGNDDSVNAVSIKRLICDTTGWRPPRTPPRRTLSSPRHRIPEEPLREDQVLVLQVPTPEPLRSVDPHEEVTRQLHADGEYTGIWVNLFEQLLTRGSPFRGADHPVLTDGRYVMNPSPIPAMTTPSCTRPSVCTSLARGGRRRSMPCRPIRTWCPWRLRTIPSSRRIFPAGGAGSAGRRTSTSTKFTTPKRASAIISAPIPAIA